jgi:hypothetical protein
VMDLYDERFRQYLDGERDFDDLERVSEVW